MPTTLPGSYSGEEVTPLPVSWVQVIGICDLRLGKGKARREAGGQIF